jgi:hypothetical protein
LEREVFLAGSQVLGERSGWDAAGVDPG